MNKMKLFVVFCLLGLLFSLAACTDSNSNNQPTLDPKNPVTISIWHYYNGAVMNAFDDLVREFNETAGLEQGIIVEAYGMGNVSDLEAAVLASVSKEVGSQDMPNIFASYADTAYAAEVLGLLAELTPYFTEEEQEKYITPYVEEGRIGLNGELRIFPLAKSTEIFMLNETDWAPFAAAYKLTHDNLATKEGLAEVAALYYEWTDAKTPDIAEDGKAFFGRDALANLMIIGSKQLGEEILVVDNGQATINLNVDAMRKIWDFYYVSYINGYFMASGRYRSDDAKVGEIISYVGSTASAAYFPQEVTMGGESYPVEVTVLPVPRFDGCPDVLVQQGAGMVVTKSTAQTEYASVIFLKWFTDVEQNIRFSTLSGYLPVRNDAMEPDTFNAVLEKYGIEVDEVTQATLDISLEAIMEGEMYTSKAFSGGTDARYALEHSLQDKAAADREAVQQLIAEGMTREEAVAQFNTDEGFTAWYNSLKAQLEQAAEKTSAAK